MLRRTAVAIKYFDHICDHIVDPNASDDAPGSDLATFLGPSGVIFDRFGDPIGILFAIGEAVGSRRC